MYKHINVSIIYLSLSLYIYIYIHVCVYIYIYIYIHIHTYKQTHTHISAHMFATRDHLLPHRPDPAPGPPHSDPEQVLGKKLIVYST